MAVRIEPTASFVASLLPGDTIVSPSKKFKPCLGKESVTLSRYFLSCAYSKYLRSNLAGFFQIKFFDFIFF